MLRQLPTFIINLDRRPDRWEQVQGELKKVGLANITRIPAVDGKFLSARGLQDIMQPEIFATLGKLRETHKELGSVGAIGCYLSHMKIWQLVAESGEAALVVEDDVKFSDTVTWPSLATLAGFDLVLLGYWDANPAGKKGVEPFYGDFTGLQLYYLTPVGANFLLNGAFPITQQVDWYMSAKLKNIPAPRSAIHTPSLASQQNSGTDIQVALRPSFSWKSFWPVMWVITLIAMWWLWRKKCSRNS